MAGKIIADIIEAPYDAIRMNVANVTVLTANSSGLTYIPTGNVNVTIGGANANLTMNILTANGIKFPATQVPSADANTLDDYEEGTWTPTDGSGAGLSFTNTSGNCIYTKIGRMVYAAFRVTYPSTANGSAARIGNLPFTSASFTVNIQPVCFSEQNLSAGAMGIVEQNATTILFLTTNGSSVSVLSNANVSGKDFRGMAIYQV